MVEVYFRDAFRVELNFNHEADENRDAGSEWSDIGSIPECRGLVVERYRDPELDCSGAVFRPVPDFSVVYVAAGQAKRGEIGTLEFPGGFEGVAA